MSQIWTGGVLMGQTATLPGGYQVTFPQLLRYTGLQATDDPGVPVIWFSFVLMLGGLMVRLYLAPLLQTREARIRRRAAEPAARVAAAVAGDAGRQRTAVPAPHSHPG